MQARLQIRQTNALLFGELLKACEYTSLTTLSFFGVITLSFTTFNFFWQNFEQVLELFIC